MIPGLLQTEECARSLIQADRPDEDTDEIERRVQLRTARQVILTRASDPTTFDVVLNEAVLRRPIGGDAGMVSQLERLLEASKLPNVRSRWSRSVRAFTSVC
ncbi:Scr1 family TA system antitoxin-like transcriptional regulator [Kitasatospora acidiphila]|uniref:Scr1 family TA system antitoxin-like transcriptional regulator n=1 Tax=Kitasatospora acidiphila TaxID=2567942 RepID=UPI001C671550